MKLSELTEDRKPYSWDEVKDEASPEELTAAEGNELPTYGAFDLWDNSNPSPTDFFRTPPASNRFIVQVNGVLYLVDTQGSNYARYVKRIPQ